MVLITFVVRTQDSIVNYSDFGNKSQDESSLGFYNIDKQYFLLIGNKKNIENINVHVYDSILIETRKNKLNLKGHDWIKSIYIHNKLVIFTSFTNSNNQEELYVHTISNIGEMSSTTIITKTQNHGGYKAKYKVISSENQEKLIIFIEQAFYKEKNEKISILYLDADFSIVNRLDKTLDRIDKNKKTNIPLISNDGCLYILKRHWDKGNKYYLYISYAGEFHETEIKLRNRKIAAMEYIIDKSGNLILAGFFTSPIRFNFEGCFTFEYKKSTHYSYKNEFIFPEKIINKFKSKKEIKSTGYGLDNFHSRKLILDSIGNQYLISEHHKFFHNKKDFKHIRKGIVAIKFTKRGKYIWGSPIITNQIENNKKSSWSSFISYINNGRLNILYNVINDDHHNNHDEKKTYSTYGENALYGANKIKFLNSGLTEQKPILIYKNKSNQKIALTHPILMKKNNTIFLIMQSEDKTKFRIVENFSNIH